MDEVNAHPGSYLQSIITECAFPPQATGLIRIPRFRHAFLPPESLVADVAGWMLAKGLAKKIPAYPEIVDPGPVVDHARAE